METATAEDCSNDVVIQPLAWHDANYAMIMRHGGDRNGGGSADQIWMFCSPCCAAAPEASAPPAQGHKQTLEILSTLAPQASALARWPDRP